MLFDDEEQLEVRHVISLAHHDISIYSGGGVTPEGELWIKRNAICLSWKRDHDGGGGGPDGQASKPFYLFTENCSAKEDFYFALLRNKEQTFGAKKDSAPSPKHFDVRHMISLVERLHASEENMHSRWVNALIGRMFLGVHRTADIENFIREKITKKIARVKRPSFLTNITLQKIDTGDAAPFFTNFKLRELMVDGDCVVECDVKYTGNFRLEVATTVKIDLGPRFKAREVNIVLAVVAKKIEGHVLLKIKPPPSNRVWIAFQTRPKMELTIEPIVSARQITYTVILRQIENRIKEIVAETLVLPFWDDIPFFRTEHKAWRGGIFEGDDAVEGEDEVDSVFKNVEDLVAQRGDVDAVDRIEEKPEVLAETRPLEKTMSLPVVGDKDSSGTRLFGRKIKMPADGPSPASSSTSLETSKIAATTGLRSPQIISSTREPVVATDSANADLFKPSTSPPDSATSYMTALRSRSYSGSPATVPHDVTGLAENPPSLSLTSEAGEEEKPLQEGVAAPPALGRRNTLSSAEAEPIGDVLDSPASTKSASKYVTGSLGRNFWMRRENSTASTAASSTTGDASNPGQKTNNTLTAVSNAALQARQWGWNAIQRQKEARARKNSNSEVPTQPVDLTQPMGRGQPLPPPGTPLPMPTNGTTKIAPRDGIKRKPMPSKQGSGSSETIDSGEEQAPAAPPQTARRRRGTSYDGGSINEGDEPPGMLVIAAPDDSQPGTPAGNDEEADTEFPWEQGAVDAAPTLGATDDDDDVDDDGLSRRTVQTTGISTPSEESIKETTQAPTQPDDTRAKEVKPQTAIPPEDPFKEEIPQATTLPETSVKEGDKPPTVAPVSPAPMSAPGPAQKVAEDDDDDYSGWMDDADVDDADVDDADGEVGIAPAPAMDNVKDGDKRYATPVAQAAK